MITSETVCGSKKFVNTLTLHMFLMIKSPSAALPNIRPQCSITSPNCSYAFYNFDGIFMLT